MVLQEVGPLVRKGKVVFHVLVGAEIFSAMKREKGSSTWEQFLSRCVKALGEEKRREEKKV
jgi:hypothetical protein